MRNISLIITSHDKLILRYKARGYCCNFRNKESRPLHKYKCSTPKVIYKAIMVTTKNWYTLQLQIQPLRSDIATIQTISIR